MLNGKHINEMFHVVSQEGFWTTIFTKTVTQKGVVGKTGDITLT